MKVIEPGHLYELAAVDGDDQQLLRFVKRFRGQANHAGTQNQEVLRVLIDRTKYIRDEMPSGISDQIIHHLRMALVLHEARALTRKVEKSELEPEFVKVNPDDGHFALPELENSAAIVTRKVGPAR